VADEPELADAAQQARGDERELDVAEVDPGLAVDDALEQAELGLLERLDLGATEARGLEGGEALAHEASAGPDTSPAGSALVAAEATAISSAADSTPSMSRMWTNFFPTLPMPTM